MSHLIAIGLILLIVTPIAFLWVRGIDYMHKNHPDYKGDDFLNWGNEDVPWKDKDWDDNKAHTEGSL